MDKTLDSAQTIPAKYKAYYFHATWCQPCKEFGPILEKVSRDYPEIDIEKVDIDSMDGTKLGLKFGIRSVPTLAADAPIHEMNGLMREEALRVWLDSLPQQVELGKEFKR
jgi:thioredoxin-like negative regulator of GroEL